MVKIINLINIFKVIFFTLNTIQFTKNFIDLSIVTFYRIGDVLKICKNLFLNSIMVFLYGLYTYQMPNRNWNFVYIWFSFIISY